MKVIFLDIDGVLNTGRYLEELWSQDLGIRDSRGHLFDPKCVSRLRKFLDDTDIKIVISSTWRMDGLSKMKELWHHRKLPGEVIDVTPVHHHGPRGREIEAWLEKHPKVEKYAIIDDDSDMLPEQLSFFVKTTWQNGIEDKHIKQLEKIL